MDDEIERRLARVWIDGKERFVFVGLRAGLSGVASLSSEFTEEEYRAHAKAQGMPDYEINDDINCARQNSPNPNPASPKGK
jgi:hypothetical protein